MLDLATHWGNGPVLIKDISSNEGISERYLEQLFLPLKAAGLVRTIRGAHGGFILTKPPAQITLGEIIQVMEGSISPSACVDDPSICPRADLCVTRGVWAEMRRAADKVLESTTLQCLVEQQKDKRRLLKKSSGHFPAKLPHPRGEKVSPLKNSVFQRSQEAE